ncbi:EI24 domain-containing protein [Haliangium ochraceum]|uniref:CysZ protein n=1 Tax=Haliangium ochraceum (strain DSM 14365 / JCM 11303 / SMP-2) TaxID=502025 RepID=D0LHF8_HALO1|nr:EI24 domain-containing protein [Haliangium ochraceum]ACY12820.1 protein of unknown function DUF540 [Haliangium ochraceum DSM 14365]
MLRGVFAALGGLRAALGNRAVYAVYFRFTLTLLVLSLVLLGGLGALVWWLTEPASAQGAAASAQGAAAADQGGLLAEYGLDALVGGGLWVLRVLGLLIAALASPLIAFLLIGIVFPVFAETLFFAGLRVMAPKRAHELEAAPGLAFLPSLWKSLRLLLHLLGYTVIALLLGIIPVVGVVLGPVVQFWGTGKVLGWELLDPYFSKRSMRYPAQREYVGARGFAFVGFGLPWMLVLAIPVIGPLLFGLAQASAPALLVRVLEPPQSAAESE